MNRKWYDRCTSIIDLINQYPSKDIILAQSWGARELICISGECDENIPKADYFITLEQQLAKLSKMVGNHRTINLIGWVPAPKENLTQCTRMLTLPDKCKGVIYTNSKEERIKVNHFLNLVASKLDNVNFINPFSSLCDNENNCKTIVDGKNLFYDKGHLSAYGSSFIWPYIEDNLKSSNKF